MFEDLEAELVGAFRYVRNHRLIRKANDKIQSLDTITLTNAGIHFTQSSEVETQKAGMKLVEVVCRRWRESDESCKSRIKAAAQSLFKNIDEYDSSVQVLVSMLLKKIISYEDPQFLEDVLKNQEQLTPVRAKYLFMVLKLLAKDEEQQAKLHSVNFPELIRKATKMTLESPSVAKSSVETISLLAEWFPVDDLLHCLSELSGLMTEAGVLLPFSRMFLAISRRDLQSHSLQTLLKLFSEFCGVCLSKLSAGHVKLISCLCSTLDELSDNPEHGCFVDLMIMFLEHKVFALHSHAVHRFAELLRENELTLTREKLSVLWGMAASRKVSTKHAGEQYTKARDLVVDRIVNLHPTIATDVLQYALKGFNETATSQESSEVQQKFWAAVHGLLSSTTERSHIDDFLENILQSGSSSAKRFTFCFAGLSPYFRAQPEKLPRCIQKLMDFFISVPSVRSDISMALLRSALESPHSAFFNALLEFMQQHQRQEEFTLPLLDSLLHAVFVSLAKASPDDQSLVVGSLLQEEHWTKLSETYLASFDLFTGALEDGRLSNAFDEPLTILRHALNISDQYKDAIAAPLAKILPRILKLILFLHSLWDPANSSRLTPVIKAAMKPLRSSCYRILVLFSERLSDSFFSSMIESAEPLSAALTKNIVEMEFAHFVQLIQVIDSFVKRCPAEVFAEVHKPLLPPILSRYLSSPTLSSQSKINPEICKLFNDFYDVVLSRAAAVVQEQDAEGNDFCLNLVVESITELRSESEPVLESIPGMLKQQLKASLKEFDRTGDPLLVEKLLRTAKELAATGICIDSGSKDMIIDCDARRGYAVTRLKLKLKLQESEEDLSSSDSEEDFSSMDSEEDLSSIAEVYGNGDYAIQKLYLSTAPEMIQSEMLIRLLTQERLTKWLVSNYQRALVALLLTVPLVKQKVLVIGFGAGMLSMFLRDVLQLRVTSVDIDRAVVSLAKTHFGVEEDDNLEIHIDDGLKFVKKQNLQSGEYDAVIVDVLSDQSGALEGINAPPGEFLEKEFLGDCRRLIHGSGALLMNTIITAAKGEPLVDMQEIDRRERIENILSEAIGEQVLNTFVDDNVCFIAYSSRQNDAIARGVETLKMLMNDKGYHLSCLESIERRLDLAAEGQFDGDSRQFITEE